MSVDENVPDASSSTPERRESCSSSASSNPSSTIFSNVSYLGSSCVVRPTDEQEVTQIIAQLNEGTSQNAMTIKIAIPAYYTGAITLFDGDSEIRKFRIAQVRCCTCGLRGTKQQECIAFSFTQRVSASDESHQCHVFRCASPQVVGHMLQCFQRVFESKDVGQPGVSVTEDFEIEMRLEIKEDDETATNGYTYCPVETNCFRLRKDRQRRIIVVIRQTQGPRSLTVGNCFGVLLAPGRYLRESDMQLLDTHDFKRLESAYEIIAPWSPRAQNFEVLNIETPKETRVFFTLALDLVLNGVNEPLRFSMECRAWIRHQMENFGHIERQPVVETFALQLLSVEGRDGKVTSFQSSAQRQRYESMAHKAYEKQPVQLIHPLNDDESDSDEPLLSGSGVVTKEVDEKVLEQWNVMVDAWKVEPDRRPPELQTLMQQIGGVPDVLRRDVWQLLAKTYKDEKLAKTYFTLLDKESISEQVILRDISRTFVAHQRFKDANGDGQEALFNISKAYSLYDEEIGYCQGLSFIAAALLLHMEVPEAFCVLVKIMQDYQLRDLFKMGFEALHLRFFQLQKLIEDHLPALSQHFNEQGIIAQYYASQWFLTLYTAKFPLQMVFLIIDLYLTEGTNTLFHVALALLQDSQRDLLLLDFEGILKHFRVTLPRKYRSEAAARELIDKAVQQRISHKRLAKYEHLYREEKRIELANLDPVERLKRECSQKDATILRLDRESDDLIQRFTHDKIALRKRLDETEDKLEHALLREKKRVAENMDLQDEVAMLRDQGVLLKEACTSELDRLQGVSKRYEQICALYEADRHEIQRRATALQDKMAECSMCKSLVTNLSSYLTDVELPDTSSSMPSQNGAGAKLLPQPSSTKMGQSATQFLMERVAEYERSLKNVESELVETKLALVEAQCRNDGLVHQISKSSNNDNAWLKKTISAVRDVGVSIRNNAAVASTPSSDTSAY